MSFKKYLPHLIKSAGVIAPALTARLALDLFLRPARNKRPEREEPTWKRATPIKTLSGAHCRMLGSGPEVWFIHGWAGRSSQFYVIVEAVVKAGYCAIMWDGPAHGDTDSALTHGKTNMIQFSQWLRKDIESRPTSPLALIGHSFGGAASTYLCGTDLRFSKLVSIAAPGIMLRVFKSYWKAIQLPERAQEYFNKAAYNLTGVNVHELTVDAIKDKTQTQVMVIHDEGDKEVSYENVSFYLKARPDAEVLTTKGLGHRRILQSKLVAENIVRFLKKVN